MLIVLYSRTPYPNSISGKASRSQKPSRRTALTVDFILPTALILYYNKSTALLVLLHCLCKSFKELSFCALARFWAKASAKVRKISILSKHLSKKVSKNMKVFGIDYNCSLYHKYN